MEDITMSKTANQGRTIYCHFNFKRPKGKNFGYFAVAMYYDYEGKQLAAKVTRVLPLWKNHQFVSAIQAYEHALYSIYKWQGIMLSKGFTNVMLVTDNSILAGWITDPKKNKAYTGYMNKAVEPYRAGGTMEITLGVGLCRPRDHEKSYKYCNEKEVVNDVKSVVVEKSENGTKNVIDLSATNMAYKTISEIEKDNINKPEIVGMD